MKKVFVLVLSLALLSALCFRNQQLSTICYKFKDATLELYCKNYKDEINKYKDRVQIIKNGKEFIIKTIASNAEIVEKCLTDCFGFCLKFQKGFEEVSFADLFAQLQVVKVENIENIETFYGYIYGLPFSTFIDKLKVNVQIAISKNDVTIGSPIILGSY